MQSANLIKESIFYFVLFMFIANMYGLLPQKLKKYTITNTFQKVLDGLLFQNNYIEMHSMHNEEKSVAAERFIRTLKNKIYKYMTSILKNMYINKLDDMLNRYNTTYHNTIKMKAVDIKSSSYIYMCIYIYIYLYIYIYIYIYTDFDRKNNKEDP